MESPYPLGSHRSVARHGTGSPTGTHLVELSLVWSERVCSKKGSGAVRAPVTTGANTSKPDSLPEQKLPPALTTPAEELMAADATKGVPTLDLSEEEQARGSAIEAFATDQDLLSALDEMEELVEKSYRSSVNDLKESAVPVDPSSMSPFKRLKQHVKAQAITNQGFGASRHLYEQEGSNAILFRDVPPWITYANIVGCRFRRVLTIEEDDDELGHFHDGITTFGYPGASGWADKIGDVAIHYRHQNWFIFSKVYPFAEQADAISAHEDALLLGSSKHVMLTPHCARSIGAGGLLDPDTSVELLNSEGSNVSKTVPISALPSAVRHRLYLTWGHKDSTFAGTVRQWERPLQELIDEKTPRRHAERRILSNILDSRIKVPERWVQYPGAPLDPAYYTDLLSKASGMSAEEEGARTLIEPVPSTRRSNNKPEVGGAGATSSTAGALAIDISIPEADEMVA